MPRRRKVSFLAKPTRTRVKFETSRGQVSFTAKKPKKKSNFSGKGLN